uniref:Uncharacterized protein n=1 Tax=Oryza meridionalis TaxID=40149 RepID=A0A0E0CIA0_9ORYZ
MLSGNRFGASLLSDLCVGAISRSNGDMLGEKINIPPGPLCAKRPDLCKNCWCCEVSDGQCYQSLEACQVNCPLPSPPAI